MLKASVIRPLDDQSTRSLSTQSVRDDEWVQGQAIVRRVGRRLAFTGGEFHVENRLMFASSAVFAVTTDSTGPT